MRLQPEVRQQMFAMIEQWHTSGLTQKAFCEQRAIRYYVFHYWYKRYRLQQDGAENNTGSFVKLQVVKPSSGGPIEINFPGGIRILFHEPVSSNYLKSLIS